MLLKVEERRRDVAALRLMGISRATIVKGIVAEAALLTLIGCALGTFIGWLSSHFINWYYQGVYRTPLYFSIITPPIVTLAVGLSLVLGLSAGLIACLRLVRTPPLTLFGR
jgi:putative ABC transport system permease protein